MAEIQPAMTFEEIAKAMGTNRKNVFMTYKRAIEKLRRRPRTMRRLQELAKSKEMEG